MNKSQTLAALRNQVLTNTGGGISAELPKDIQTAVLAPGDPLDLSRVFSGGKDGAKTFLDEEANAIDVSIQINNASDTDVKIVFGGVNHSMYGSAAALVTALGATAVADDGVVFSSTGDCTITSLDSGRKVAHMMNYAGQNPFRLTRMALNSTLISDGSADTTNYSGSLKTVFASPWLSTLNEDYLQLRKFQNSRTVSPQYADINFLKERFKVALSSENFLIVTVKAGTKLTMTNGIGMQLSLAQYAHREMKKADSYAEPIRSKRRGSEM